MVTFKISGSLPSPWEDFLSLSDGVPNITIMTLAEAVDNGFEFDDPVSDGWLDLVIDVPCIDADAARLAIADALAIGDPEDIVIIEAGFCRAV